MDLYKGVKIASLLSVGALFFYSLSNLKKRQKARENFVHIKNGEPLTRMKRNKRKTELVRESLEQFPNVLSNIITEYAVETNVVVGCENFMNSSKERKTVVFIADKDDRKKLAEFRELIYAAKQNHYYYDFPSKSDNLLNGEIIFGGEFAHHKYAWSEDEQTQTCTMWIIRRKKLCGGGDDAIYLDNFDFDEFLKEDFGLLRIKAMDNCASKRWTCQWLVDSHIYKRYESVVVFNNRWLVCAGAIYGYFLDIYDIYAGKMTKMTKTTERTEETDGNRYPRSIGIPLIGTIDQVKETEGLRDIAVKIVSGILHIILYNSTNINSKKYVYKFDPNSFEHLITACIWPIPFACVNDDLLSYYADI